MRAGIAMREPFRKLLRGVAFVVVALVGGVLLLEAGLQAAALVVRATGRELPTGWSTGHHRVLCLGDSNTYGLWLDRPEAYPARLEELWNEGGASPSLEVLNLGVPGMSASRVARDLPRILQTFEPDRLLVMLGVNDYWTRRVDEPAPEAPRRSFLERHSRVYKRIAMLLRARDDRELEVELGGPPPGTNKREWHADHRIRFGDEEFSMGYEAGEGAERGNPRTLFFDLITIVEHARAFGVPIHLMTYPARWNIYESANGIIRRAAKRSGAPLIDLARVFEPLCAEEECPKYLLRDDHPNERGYRVVAETILDRLREDG